MIPQMHRNVNPYGTPLEQGFRTIFFFFRIPLLFRNSLTIPSKSVIMIVRYETIQ